MNDTLIIPEKYKGLRDYIAKLRQLNPDFDKIVADIQWQENVDFLTKQLQPDLINSILNGECDE